MLTISVKYSGSLIFERSEILTYDQINNLRALRPLIRNNEERLAEIEARLDPGIMKMDGMPRNNSAKSMIESLMPQIIELKGLIHKQNMEYIDTEIEIEKYIASVQDYTDRLILTLRFIRGMSWREVASRVGGGNTSDSVRKRAFRLIEKNK